MPGSFFDRIRCILRPPVFEVVFERGAVRVRRGRVRKGFVEDCTEIARTHRLESGWIRGRKQGREITLEFSRDIPAALHQRLRNAWHFHA